MIRILRRFRFAIALSLAAQGVLGPLWWWRPEALPGSWGMALTLFPGVILGWAAIHTSLVIGGTFIVCINLLYHVAIAAALSSAFRRLRAAV
jgi:hypothetical protein